MTASKKKYGKKTFGKTKYKFGVEVPNTGDVRGAMRLDKQNNNTLWFDTQKKEATSLRDLNTFRLMPNDFDLTGYQYVPLIYAWDVKFDGHRRARLVANGKVTIGPPEPELCLPHGRHQREDVYHFGAKFGDWAGKKVIIDKTLYGLVGSCAQFHCHLCGELAKLGFTPSKADPDLWMHDA
eukprot:9846431-Ditylum_brightwellii.AAC.1